MQNIKQITDRLLIIWAAYQRKYPILQNTTLLEAITAWDIFLDNPQGLLQEYIDSVLLTLFVRWAETDIASVKSHLQTL